MRVPPATRPMLLAIACLAICCLTPLSTLAAGGQLKLRILDSVSGEPIAVRMALKNNRRRPAFPKAKGIVKHADHFIIDGEMVMKLPVGAYTFQMNAGPEYLDMSGHFDIANHANDEKTVKLRRFADLRNEGWRSGDLAVSRTVKDAPLLLKSEDLSQLALTTEYHRLRRSRGSNAIGESDAVAGVGQFTVCAQRESTPGGTFWVYHLSEEGNDRLQREGLGPWVRSDEAMRASAEMSPAVAVQANHWMLPVMAADDLIDVLLLMDDSEEARKPTGRPRDELLFPDGNGPGRNREAIYHHLLEAGLRVAPGALTNSGQSPQPPGIARVFVRTGEDDTPLGWWQALVAGQAFVTNGPLLRVDVAGYAPGHVFRLQRGESRTFQIGAKLAFREKVRYLEVIKNGRTLHNISLDEWKAAQGRIPDVVFDEPGWFLVKAVTNASDSYTYATTGAYFVEVDGQSRRSRVSIEYFRQWMAELREQLHSEADRAAWQRGEVFWRDLLQEANAD